jgi:hypothetical protein
MKLADKTTRWETRRNALETLRKICKSIMLCDEQLIRYEVMKDGVTLAEYGEDMVTLAKGMTDKERKRYDDEALFEKLVELQDFCEWETDWPELKRLLDAFEVGKKPNATRSPVKRAGTPVVVDLDADSGEEVEEQSKYDALIAFDKSRGCFGFIS